MEDDLCERGKGYAAMRYCRLAASFNARFCGGISDAENLLLFVLFDVLIYSIILENIYIIAIGSVITMRPFAI